MSNRYTQAFKRLDIALTPVSDKYGVRKLYFFIDAFWSLIRYGITPNEYIGFGFYKLSRLERKQYYTARHSAKYEKLFNDRKFYETFWHKEKTNTKFKNFLKRDWLYAPDATDEEINTFLQTHDKVIVKPTNQSSGHGIYVYNDEPINTLKENSCLIEEFVCQHHKMAAINSTSVNTVRVYTLLKINQLLPPYPKTRVY